MPRFRNVRTGSVVNVDDATAARLPTDDYEPVEKPATRKPAPRRRTRAKADTDE